MPGFEELGWVTYTPGRFTGVGFTCRMIPNESWLEQAIGNGKVVLKALKIIEGL